MPCAAPTLRALSTTLRVIGTALAGIPYNGIVEPGTCVRIMTGAVLPDEADTVLMQEQVQRSGEEIIVQGTHNIGENVRHIGEDIAFGSVVLAAGRRLMPSDLGLIASLGVGEVSVYRRLRVAFFSTGDELRSIGEPLAAGQIYDSNRYTLYGMLTRLGAEVIDMGVIPDQRPRIEAAFQDAAQAADVVITSGGVSVGEADYVKETLDRLGNVDFWKIAMKPGKPLAFGKVQQALFFGLPGNPVSVMATFYQFVLPALRHLMGEPAAATLTIKVPCAQALKKKPGRTDFQRGLLVRNAERRIGCGQHRPAGFACAEFNEPRQLLHRAAGGVRRCAGRDSGRSATVRGLDLGSTLLFRQHRDGSPVSTCIRLGQFLVHFRHIQCLDLGDDVFQCGGRQHAGLGKDDDLLAEYHQGGDRAYLEIACEFCLVFGVDLGEHDIGMVLRSLFVDRREAAAGTAPRRPEINDDDIVVGYDLLEIVFVYFNGSHVTTPTAWCGSINGARDYTEDAAQM